MNSFTEFWFPAYLDASAAARLFTDEMGHENIKRLFREKTGFFMTSFCIYETMNVLKNKKWNKDENIETKDHAYAQDVYVLMSYPEDKSIQIDDDFSPLSKKGFTDVQQIAQKYSLDFADAFQIIAILKGKWRHTAHMSKTMLITADEALVKAAQTEGLRVWDCKREPFPL